MSEVRATIRSVASKYPSDWNNASVLDNPERLNRSGGVKRTKICQAFLGPNNALVYVKHPKDQAISYEILRNLPTLFQGQSFDYDRALRPFLESYLAKS